MLREAVIIFVAAHCSGVGILEPIINIGAPGIVDTAIPTAACPGASVENVMLWPERAARKDFEALSVFGSPIPKYDELTCFTAPGATFQCALSNIFENCA